MPRMKTLMIMMICSVVSCFACPLNEYKVGNICCPLCPPGWFFVKDCTENTMTNCSKCPVGTFQADHNVQRQCSSCTKCDAGLCLKEKRACSSKSDAVCEPLDVDCRVTQRRTVCSPGHYVSQRGTADEDTECLHCTDGTYSNGTSSHCNNHTKCESVGLELMKPGTDSTDSECGGRGADIGLVAGGISGVVLVVASIIIIAIILRKKIRVWIIRQKKRDSQEQEMELTVATPLKSSDPPAPTGDQQEHSPTSPPAATMDVEDGDQSPAPSPPSSPTHNGPWSVTVHQEDAAIVSPSSDYCTINVSDPLVIFKRDIGAF